MVIHAQGQNFPKSLQVSQAKDKCLKETFKLKTSIQGDLAVFINALITSMSMKWHDSITMCYILTFTHTSEGLICASDVFLK